MAEEAACVAMIFDLALRCHQPTIANECARHIRAVTADARWLKCFAAACDQDASAAATLVCTFASWQPELAQLSADQLQAILDAGLIQILPDVGSGGAAVAVIHDIRVLGRLLDAHGLDVVIAAHVVQLKRLLESSAAARAHGVSLVQDLATLDLALVRRMMDPRSLRAQAQAARFLLSAFPVRWHLIVVVDAPASFGMLWKAASVFLPTSFANSVQFLSRPSAASRCEHLFGRPVI